MEKETKSITRRGFVASAMAGGALAAFGALAGGAPQDQPAADSQAGAEADQPAASSSARPNPGEGHSTSISPAGPDAEPIEPLPVPEAWDGESDVVIVGTGLGGLTAALYCLQGGLSVTAIEKSAVVGGAGRHAANNHVNCGGSKAQVEAGYAWPGKTFNAREAAVQFEILTGQHSIDTKLLLRTIEEGASWADWIVEQDGVHLVLQPVGPLANMCYVDEDVASGAQNVILGNERTVNALEADILAAGGQILTSTECTGLVVDESGAVVGVAVGEGDAVQHFKGSKGVILCAGGFGYNLDMLEKYAPSAYMYANQGGPTTAHTGEAIRMGVGAGADIAGYNSFCCWETGQDQYWGDGDGEYWHYLWQLGRHITVSPFLRLNVFGDRLPIYSLAQPEYIGCQFSFAVESNAAVQMAAPGHNAYVILDSKFKEYQQMFAEMGIVSPVLTGTISEAGLNYVNPSWEEDFEEMVALGAIKKADTLEELAELSGMLPADLVAAVDRWNATVESGQDDNLVPVPAPFMTPVLEAPFYCIKTGGQIGKTLAGLRVNDYGQVISTEGRVIPGLYAGFTTAGGYVGENLFMGQFGMVGPMGSAAMSGTGGYICAKRLLGELERYNY